MGYAYVNDRLCGQCPLTIRARCGACRYFPNPLGIDNHRKNDTGQGQAVTTSRSLGAKRRRRLAAKRSFI